LLCVNIHPQSTIDRRVNDDGFGIGFCGCGVWNFEWMECVLVCLL